MASYYRKPLARIHDNYYGDIARNAATEILDIIGNQPLHRSIDLGCGSGIFASLLAKKNIAVIGVDISDDFLAMAREKAPNATFVHASLFDYVFEPADIITAIGEPFNYLFDGKANYEELAKLFRAIYANVSDSGVFMFDILTDNVDTHASARMVEKDEMTMFIEIDINTLQKVLTRKMTYFSLTENGYQKDTETHKQYLYNTEIIEQLLLNTGFHYKKKDGYGQVQFRQGHIAFICSKTFRAKSEAGHLVQTD